MRKIDLNNFQVATNETVRDINSRIMLNLVRKHQPVSRADLMRYSGLQRSTVSAIAGRLIAERWLKEGAVGDLPRGRKPTFLHLNTERCGVMGVDIQPAWTTLAVSSMDSQFLAQESMPTAKGSGGVHCPVEPPDHGFNPGASPQFIRGRWHQLARPDRRWLRSG